MNGFNGGVNPEFFKPVLPSDHLYASLSNSEEIDSDLKDELLNFIKQQKNEGQDSSLGSKTGGVF